MLIDLQKYSAVKYFSSNDNPQLSCEYSSYSSNCEQELLSDIFLNFIAFYFVQKYDRENH